MRQATTYEFDDDEIHVLAEALAMYASYNQEMVLPMLVGDESDLEERTKEASVSQRMAHHFVEEDRGERWEELSRAFKEYHDRPMDMSDVSAFDFFEHRTEEA